jgi:hypothetical protein
MVAIPSNLILPSNVTPEESGDLATGKEMLILLE